MTVARQTFQQQIAQNKRRSWVLLLVLTVILMALGALMGYAMTGEALGAVWAVIGALVLSVVLSAGAWFGGDSLVLSASQAREVGPADAPQLINVVQEMSLAAGTPMPRVYLIPDSAPNAFATGRDPQHASVAVTTGLLDKLDREELQGVIGHEISHVRNYDIRFTLLVGVLVGSIALLADMFLRVTFWGGASRRGRSKDSGGGAQAIIMIVAVVLAVLAPFFARLVQMAVSRQREFLADASSVSLTRNPVGLERALVTISRDQEPLEVANRATQHLYIVNPMKQFEGRRAGLFSTHPPIRERVDRLRVLSGQPALDAASERSLAGLD
ncbi:MAG: zinc metalloprotease HtpX [Chloroflexi bacterium]|nr:zinc metalloprotease HtpX [Chloroflexota bacterium]